MIRAARNNVIISVSSAFTKTATDILKLSSIQNIATVNPVDYVEICGLIVSLPYSITNEEREYEGFSLKDIRVGDMAIFRYDLIFDFIQKTPESEPVFRHRIWHDAKEFWSCDVQKIFGVIRNGEIIMVNGYVMIEDFAEMRIILKTSSRKARGTQKSKVLYIGNPKENEFQLNINNGDTVFFNPTKAAQYKINDKKFRIIQQKFILGKIKS